MRPWPRRITRAGSDPAVPGSRRVRAAARFRSGRAQRADRPPGAPALREEQRPTKPGGDIATADEKRTEQFSACAPDRQDGACLTTESDGGAQYAQLVADELGIPALDVRVVPATPTGSVSVTATTPARRRATGGGRRRHRKDSREGATARGHGAGSRTGDPQGVNGHGSARDGSDPAQVKTVEEIALRARHRRPAAGGSRAARRADRLQR